MEFRHFTDADYEAVCDYLIELNKRDRTHINWNWARFEWMYEHPEFDKSARDAIGLWFDGDRVVGAAIYDMYFGEAFCGVLPEYEALYPAVLQYAYDALKDENGLAIAICDTNAAEIEAAKRAGFTPIDQTETIMEIDLDAPRDAALKEGFTLYEPHPVEDAEKMQWLFWQGFDHGENRAEFEREETVAPKVRKHMRRELGIAAVDETGEYAAFCCLWYSEKTDYAYVEPVCTIPRHRGKGLAKALLCEAMNRARALGAKTAYVISDMPFYEKLGFRKAYQYTFYRKA
ncbi:MAG: GNAT family N-acetyltransferase [Clostridia bacterium]|nr:GNAT family N-acetyltransferase [Clostridia bacterium]